MDELEQFHACNLDQRPANFLFITPPMRGLHATQQMLVGHLGTTREGITAADC